MIRLSKMMLALSCLLAIGQAHAYGSGGSSSTHCEKPTFSDFSPAPNKYLQSFDEFALVASANTTPSSITVNVSAGSLKYVLHAKQLQISEGKHGKWNIEGKVPRPIEHGFVRLSVSAHSKPGCEATTGYLIRIH